MFIKLTHMVGKESKTVMVNTDQVLYFYESHSSPGKTLFVFKAPGPAHGEVLEVNEQFERIATSIGFKL